MRVLLTTLLFSVIWVFGIGTVKGQYSNESNSGACIYYPLKTGAEWKLEGFGRTTPSLTFKILGTEKIEDIISKLKAASLKNMMYIKTHSMHVVKRIVYTGLNYHMKKNYLCSILIPKRIKVGLSGID